jgi:hypothetical protein
LLSGQAVEHKVGHSPAQFIDIDILFDSQKIKEAAVKKSD